MVPDVVLKLFKPKPINCEKKTQMKLKIVLDYSFTLKDFYILGNTNKETGNKSCEYF